MELGEHSTIAGKYLLEQKLGQGGMGSVWRARHQILDAPVAVKLLRSDRAELAGMRARFETEAMAMAKLKSRHVITIHDYGIEGTHAYIVMEMLEGEDLGARLKRETRLSLEASRRIVEQMCRGLQAAHDAGIVHRDLKPANIFLTVEDDEEIAKILDFGIAKSEGAHLSEGGRRRAKTSTGVLLGSPFYMSPEHIQGEWSRVDHRSDLWSVAVIGYRMLTGLQPFTGDVLPALMKSIFAGSVQRAASQTCAGLDGRIDAFFDRTFARDPDQRFGSAREMAAAWNDCFGVPTSTFTAAEVEPVAKPSPQGSTGHIEETQALDPARLAALARDELASLPLDPVDAPTATMAPASLETLSAGTTPAPRAPSRPVMTAEAPTPRSSRTAAIAVVSLLVVTAGGAWAARHLGGEDATEAPPPRTARTMPEVARPRVVGSGLAGASDVAEEAPSAAGAVGSPGEDGDGSPASVEVSDDEARTEGQPRAPVQPRARPVPPRPPPPPPPPPSIPDFGY